MSVAGRIVLTRERVTSLLHRLGCNCWRGVQCVRASTATGFSWPCSCTTALRHGPHRCHATSADGACGHLPQAALVTELEVARRQRDNADLRAASLEEEVRTPLPRDDPACTLVRLTCHTAAGVVSHTLNMRSHADSSSSSYSGPEVRSRTGRDQRGGQGPGQALAAEGGGQHEAVGGGAQGRPGAGCRSTGEPMPGAGYVLRSALGFYLSLLSWLQPADG